jgi:fructoselysine-6-P-deglycase FrlB-like protein
MTPYEQELSHLDSTLSRAAQVDISGLKTAISGASEASIIAVGSGGSFTVASLLCNLHEAYTGHVSRAITPLELICNPTLASASPIFVVSAEGKNPDVLEALQRARKYGSRAVHVITNRADSPLMDQVKSLKDVSAQIFDLAEKDGYLATNSLVFDASLIARAYGELDQAGVPNPLTTNSIRLAGQSLKEWLADARTFVTQASGRIGLIIVFSPRLKPLAEDLESKFSEAALLSTQLCDFRSFAHGRHLWLTERSKDTALPVWLAGRSIALSNEFISQGVRSGRDIRDYPLEELWGGRTSQQFVGFAQNILDRRFALQSVVPGGSFVQYLADVLTAEGLDDAYAKALASLEEDVRRVRHSGRFSEWIAIPERRPVVVTADVLFAVYATRILVARESAKKQLSLELGPLTTEDLEERDSSAVQGAAEIFANYEQKVPYYFGLERLCAMATNNVEELLGLAAALYDGMKAKQVLRRRTQPQLLPREQEKRIKEAAERKRDFIPRNHTEGTRAQKLLDSIGVYCRERTFLMNAPYAPGVTGVRLSNTELLKLQQLAKSKDHSLSRLEKVLSECVAENLLTIKESSASTSREGGKSYEGF